MYVIKQRFWWPAMEKAVAEYAAACSVCARNKSMPWAQWACCTRTSNVFLLVTKLLIKYVHQSDADRCQIR